MTKLPADPATFVDALAGLAKKQKAFELLVILDAAEAEYILEEQDWGIAYYHLSLVVPWDVFAGIADTESVETALSQLANAASKGVKDEHCRRVSISHRFDAPNDWRTGARPVAISTSDLDRIWSKPGWFRLFISHRATIKKEAHQLRKALAKRHVDAFVAHDDIEPSLAWQREIELALSSCHAVAALTSEDFHESVWCMQEVGWALGRGVLVLPVQIPLDPQGFISGTQGLRGSLSALPQIREPLIDVLAGNTKTTKQMHEPLVLSLERASDPVAITIVVNSLQKVQALSEDHARRLLAATKTNVHLQADKAEVRRIESLVAKFGVPTEATLKADEYDPFADE